VGGRRRSGGAELKKKRRGGSAELKKKRRAAARRLSEADWLKEKSKKKKLGFSLFQFCVFTVLNLFFFNFSLCFHFSDHSPPQFPIRPFSPFFFTFFTQKKK
jgi:hypothetical protein